MNFFQQIHLTKDVSDSFVSQRNVDIQNFHSIDLIEEKDRFFFDHRMKDFFSRLIKVEKILIN